MSEPNHVLQVIQPGIVLAPDSSIKLSHCKAPRHDPLLVSISRQAPMTALLVGDITRKVVLIADMRCDTEDLLSQPNKIT